MEGAAIWLKSMQDLEKPTTPMIAPTNTAADPVGGISMHAAN